jgi:hypothetical protein
MRINGNAATVIIVLFFVVFFTVVLALQRQYPVLAISGEQSPGTWMSGVLLLLSAGLSLSLSFRRMFPWMIIFVFFLVLAIDERFMIHEQLKERVVFAYPRASRFLYELPVMLAACVGSVVAWVLFSELDTAGRVLLAGAALLGATSVIIDVLAAGVLVEDAAKLLAELFVTLAMARRGAKSNI